MLYVGRSQRYRPSSTRSLASRTGSPSPRKTGRSRSAIACIHLHVLVRTCICSMLYSSLQSQSGLCVHIIYHTLSKVCILMYVYIYKYTCMYTCTCLSWCSNVCVHVHVSCSWSRVCQRTVENWNSLRESCRS